MHRRKKAEKKQKKNEKKQKKTKKTKKTKKKKTKTHSCNPIGRAVNATDLGSNPSMEGGGKRNAGYSPRVRDAMSTPFSILVFGCGKLKCICRFSRIEKNRSKHHVCYENFL